jgi:HipA-like protein
LELEVFLGERRVGILAQTPGGDFSCTYDATWVVDPERFALSPYLPLPGEADPARLPRASPENSMVVRDFFQNLLPEGKSLDAAAAAAKVSKRSLVGLLASLGAECMGALRILPAGVRLLRPPRSGIFLRSFPLHSAHYARETIAEICSMGVALAMAPLSPTGS